MNTLTQKLNRANRILAKLRYYVSANFLKTIYYALFDSHMRYARQIWGHSHSKISDMIQTTQNKALRIINFKQFFLNVLNLSNLLKVPSVIDDSKIRLRYNILFMKPQSSNTTTTF